MSTAIANSAYNGLLLQIMTSLGGILDKIHYRIDSGLSHWKFSSHSRTRRFEFGQ